MDYSTIQRHLQACNNPNWMTRKEGIKALAKVYTNEVTQTAIALVKDPERAVRSYAVQALSHRNENQVIDVLTQVALRDSHWMVHQGAMESLGTIISHEVALHIIEYLESEEVNQSRDELVIEAALSALIQADLAENEIQRLVAACNRKNSSYVTCYLNKLLEAQGQDPQPRQSPNLENERRLHDSEEEVTQARGIVKKVLNVGDELHIPQDSVMGITRLTLMHLLKLPGPEITDQELREGKVGSLIGRLFPDHLTETQIDQIVHGSFTESEQNLLRSVAIRRHKLLNT